MLSSGTRNKNSKLTPFQHQSRAALEFCIPRPRLVLDMIILHLVRKFLFPVDFHNNYMTTIIFLTLLRISLFILSDNRSKQANHNGPHKWSNKSFSRPYSLVHKEDETSHIAQPPPQSPLHYQLYSGKPGERCTFFQS